MAEIKFRRDTAFRKQFFVPDSFAHPAKMDSQLLMWLVSKYTEPNETILDPMAGSGTTMLACNVGRNVILVELEGKFCKMMRDNWGLVKMKPQLGCQMGTCQIIQGDARNLEGLLADKIITSPPYAEQPLPSRTNHGILNHKPDCKCNFCRKNRGTKGMIQGYRQADKIITSPPYAETSDRGAWTEEFRKKAEAKHHRTYTKASFKDEDYGKAEGQISNLPYGDIDKIITSPPYAETGVGDWKTGRDEFQAWVIEQLETKGYVEWQGKRYTESEWRAMNHGRLDGRTTKGVHKHPTNGYGKSAGQIGNKPYGDIDSIITSSDENMLGGLIAGEGSFFISIQRDERMRLGYQLHPNFSLDLVESPADRLLIQKTQKIFNCGKIRTRKDKRPECQPIIEFYINRLDDLVGKVIPLCDKIIPQSAKRLSFERWKELVLMMAKGEHLTDNGFAYIKERIANINNHCIDSVIFSPPYEGSINTQDDIEARAERIAKAHPGKRNRWSEPSFTEDGHSGRTWAQTYSPDSDNIGNLKSDTYLEAMLQVYQQCFKVLKDGGLMILVTKNFIRNKQVVRLDTDTIKLCEQARFSYVERHWRKLPAQSFWRIIYQKKFPDVEQILYEDVLVFKK